MDYYSVIALAVSRLPSKTDEARREIYERARTALQEGLRGLDPPLSETVIANEEAALDAAICTLEVVTDMGGNAFVVLLWLSAKAGLRAGEIAHLTWEMVTDPKTMTCSPA